MSALTEKIRSLAESNDFDTLVEVLLELEARQPSYTIQMFPNPAPIPAIPSGWSGWTPFPPFERPFIGDPYLPNGGTTCKFVANDPSSVGNASSDATGYVEPSVSDPAGIGTRIDLQQKVGFGG